VQRILVIHDDTGSERAVSRILGTVNYEVIGILHNSFGIDFLHTTQPNLVVLDSLPTKSGQDLCRRIKNEFRTVPLFVLAATNDRADVSLLLNLGADDYMAKPFSPREFQARVHRRLPPA
jgi:DNA-binding response OmpR family regulator